MQHTLPKYSKVKGVHPGADLKRELTKRNVKAIELANAIDEYPQTINAITKEKRGINPKLSIKLGDYFNIEKEYFMLLQASFEVKSSLQESNEN
ncbi:MAG: plasmid maintenance system antidote protein, partial [Spirosomataceae bacterium]